MTDLTRDRISAFLAQYIEMADGDSLIPRTDNDFRSSFKLLLKEQVFASKKYIKLECVKEHDVIIPDYLFEGIEDGSD